MKPETLKRMLNFFYFFLCILLMVDLIAFFLFDRHGHFSWEEIPFFNAVYGFTACVSLIFVAKVLRWIVKRKEGYYD